MAFKFDPKKQVTSNLKFKPSNYDDLNGLVLGTLQKVEVELEESPKIKDDGSENPYQFAGMKVPTLKFIFKNHLRPEDKDRADRFFTHAEKNIVSVKNNGEKIAPRKLESLYDSMWSRIKHIHDAFENTPNYKPFESLPEIDPAAPDDKLNEQFINFFQTVADAFNKGKDGKPIFVDDKGVNIVCYMKLVADYNTRKYLAFPTYVGEGFIERYKVGVPPTIELKPSETQKLSSSEESSKERGTSGSAAGTDDIPKEILDAMKE